MSDVDGRDERLGELLDRAVRDLEPGSERVPGSSPPSRNRTARAIAAVVTAAVFVGAAATNDRYQLIAQVSGAVACAWLDRWFTGRETGDQALQEEAAAALATSHGWPMLTEIADQGGWADEVWIHADAANGGTIITGRGPTEPTRELANSALGCHI